MTARLLCNTVETLLVDAWGQTAVDEFLRPERTQLEERRERRLAALALGGEVVAG